MRTFFTLILISVLATAGWGQDVANLVGANYSAFAKTSQLAEESSEVTFLTRQNDILLTTGDVDGVLGYLIVDTGAPGLIIDVKYATQHVGPSEKLHGVTGTTTYQTTVVNSLKVDRLRQTEVPALVVDLSYLTERLNLPVLGIIGHAQLKDFPVEISVKDNSLAFHQSIDRESASNENATAYQFSLLGHLPVLSAIVGSHDLDFAFDTGSGVNLIDKSYFELLSDDLRGRPAKRLLAGIDANPTEVTCALVRLTFLEEKGHKDRPFLFSDLSVFEAAEVEVAGVLSPKFWNAQDFMIDYTEGYVIIRE